MNINALDSALENFMDAGQEVSITLRDNSTVAGKVKSFDAYVILLAGGPDTMVYRHSILKLTERPKVAETPKTEHKPRAPERPAPRPKTAPQPRKRPARAGAEPAQPKEAAADKPLGTLGEAMLKWLQSQQGK